MILIDVVDCLQAAGASVTSTSSVDQALLLVEHEGLSAAILDHVLGDAHSSALCARLSARSVPFMMYSGMHKVPGECSGAPHLDKPAFPDVLVQAIVDLIERDPEGPALIAR